MRLCFLSVPTCVAGWVGSVSGHVSGVMGAQPVFCLHSGRGNSSSPTSMGLRKKKTAPGSHCPSGSATSDTDEVFLLPNPQALLTFVDSLPR